MIRLTAFLLFLFSLPLLADTQVTHTFEDGEVISAEEFNKNFDDLEAAIDAVGGGGGGGGGASIFVWRDANGTLFPFFGGYGGVVYKFPESERVFGIYYDGTYYPGTVYFPTSDCSGDGFMVPRTRGTLEAGRSSTHWLVPDYSASPTEFPALGAGNWSKLDSNGCQAGTNSTSDASIGDVLPVIQSSAPLNPITAPVELIWAD